MSEILEKVGLKTCSKCKQTLPLSAFGKDKNSKDGLFTYCKLCTRARINKYNEENRDYVNEQQRQYRDENREYLNEQQRQYRQNSKVKRKMQVNNITNNAIRTGELIRPDACPQCGANDSTIEAHHWSYEVGDELDVLWLCRKCHAALHVRNRID